MLEALYLGVTGEYEIHFTQDQMAKVEDIFDFIIYKHGIKEVYFRYVISQTQDWRSSPVQKIRIEQKNSVPVKSAS